MIIHEEDPDVVRWGLHHLLDVCSLSNSGSVTHYNRVSSQEQSVKQGFCQSVSSNVESDRMIAQALQEELSRLADAEAAGLLHAQEEQQEPVLSQDWGSHSQRHYDSVSQSNQEDEDEVGPICLCPDPEEVAVNSVSQSNQEHADRAGSFCLCPDPDEIDIQTEQCSPVIENESTLDGEVGRRLNHMVPVPHVPRTNREMPTVDEATSDHQRLLERLVLYDLVELKVSGDGNCQGVLISVITCDLSSSRIHFNIDSLRRVYYSSRSTYMILFGDIFRSLSDQIYRTFEHHEIVRQQVVDQLRSYPEWYESYVPMGYDDYIRRMSKNGEWGDHVTLQAAADSYGLRIFVITSFKDTCYIEILPREQKSKRMITLSFWAEVHYNSIYPNGELPAPETTKRKRRWWWRVI